MLDLEDLPLSATKINKSLLSSSPYSMHSGSIRSLRIVLPSLSELSAKSIEVHISNVQICLRPNKQFESNFTERVSELKYCGGYAGTSRNTIRRSRRLNRTSTATTP